MVYLHNALHISVMCGAQSCNPFPRMQIGNWRLLMCGAAGLYSACLAFSGRCCLQCCTGGRVSTPDMHYRHHAASTATLLCTFGVEVGLRNSVVDRSICCNGHTLTNTGCTCCNTTKTCFVCATCATLDVLPVPAPLPSVPGVLGRWWSVKIANTYKEAAWKLALDAFPTAARMSLTNAFCVACGAQCPSISHHFLVLPGISGSARYLLKAN